MLNLTCFLVLSAESVLLKLLSSHISILISVSVKDVSWLKLYLLSSGSRHRFLGENG